MNICPMLEMEHISLSLVDKGIMSPMRLFTGAGDNDGRSTGR